MKEEKIDSITGLTNQENNCHYYLMKSYKEWLQLEIQHPDETRDFANAIHVIQGLLAIRIARRMFPNCWKNHNIKKS